MFRKLCTKCNFIRAEKCQEKKSEIVSVKSPLLVVSMNIKFMLISFYITLFSCHNHTYCIFFTALLTKNEDLLSKYNHLILSVYCLLYKLCEFLLSVKVFVKLLGQKFKQI